MSRKRRRKLIKDDEVPEDMALQITSMADIFTIILVFLLKSFSTGLATLQPTQGMHLPSVTTSNQEAMKEAVKIEILPNAILVDQKAAVTMTNFRAPGSVTAEEEQAANEDITLNPLYKPVFQALTHEKGKATTEADRKDTNLMVLADERTPYATLRTVMASAANAGFVDLQLVVLGAD